MTFKMRVLSLLLFLLSIVPMHLPAQQFLWTEQAGGPSYDGGHDVTTDLNGNIITVGRFGNSCLFQSNSVSSNGDFDVYLVKYDPNRNVLWSINFGGPTDDDPAAVTTDNIGNIYVAASVNYNSVYDTTMVPGFGNRDIAVAKYNANGQFQWVKTFGGPGYDTPYSIAYSNGYLYLSGSYEETAVFDADTLDCSSLEQDGFVLRMNANGQIDWIKRAVCYREFTYMRIAMDAADNIYVVGEFEGTAYFGAQVLQGSPGLNNLMVAKMQTDGTVNWAKKATGRFTHGASIAASPSGQVFVTGSSVNTFTIDGHSFAGEDQMYTFSLDPAGNFKWLSQAFSTTNMPQTWAIVADDHDNVYVASGFQDSAFVGTDTLLSNTDQTFLIHYDPNGQLVQTLQTKSGNPFSNCRVSGLSWDGDASLYLTGSYLGDVNFGTDLLLMGQSFDVFLSKLSTETVVHVPPTVAALPFSLYPNPARGHFNLDIPGFVGRGSLELYGADGRVVHREGFVGGSLVQVDVDLASGVYLGVITGGGRRGVFRVVLE